jgi:hypothetical protein
MLYAGLVGCLIDDCMLDAEVIVCWSNAGVIVSYILCAVCCALFAVRCLLFAERCAV